jgi:TrmH family RNA methyltransferase
MFTQRFVRTSREELMRWKRRSQYFLAGASPGAARDYQEVSYRLPVILLIGNERKGLSPELQAMCDLVVSIPMVGESDSLNVATATGVLLYPTRYGTRNGCGGPCVKVGSAQNFAGLVCSRK